LSIRTATLRGPRALERWSSWPPPRAQSDRSRRPASSSRRALEHDTGGLARHDDRHLRHGLAWSPSLPGPAGQWRLTVYLAVLNDFRYDAACFAMNCADGKGISTPAPAERAAYRKQALELQTAELAATRKLIATNRAFVHIMMTHWLSDPDLESG